MIPKYDPNIEINDVLYESPLRRVDFDKVCFEAKYQVFARNSPHEVWRHVAEATTEEEALAISKDDDRCFGGELLTEVDRRRASALRQLLDSELMRSSPDVLSEKSLEKLNKQLKDLQDEGIPITLDPKKVTLKKRGSH